jgi:hypothetical protein
MNEKKYVPGRGAVKIPDDKFMAPPMFSFSISKGIGVPFVEKLVSF